MSAPFLFVYLLNYIGFTSVDIVLGRWKAMECMLGWLSAIDLLGQPFESDWLNTDGLVMGSSTRLMSTTKRMIGD